MNPVYRAWGYTTGAVTCEIVFTALRNPPHFEGNTQLWVIPLYSLGSIYAFEPLHNKFKDKPLPFRALIYAIMFLSLEYLGGVLAKRIIGKCPWHYDSKFSVHGYINLTYAPLWAMLGLVAERAHLKMLSFKE